MSWEMFEKAFDPFSEELRKYQNLSMLINEDAYDGL